MKKILTASIVLLLPAAVLAGVKDVFVTNPISVELLHPPEDSVDLASSYRPLNLQCELAGGTICTTNEDPNPADPALVHSLSLSVLADPGHRCVATLFVSDSHGSGNVLRPLLVAHATEFAPGVATLAYPRPIRLESRDTFTFLTRNVDGQNGGCEATAYVGVELLLP